MNSQAKILIKNKIKKFLISSTFNNKLKNKKIYNKNIKVQRRENALFKINQTNNHKYGKAIYLNHLKKY